MNQYFIERSGILNNIPVPSRYSIPIFPQFLSGSSERTIELRDCSQLHNYLGGIFYGNGEIKYTPLALQGFYTRCKK